MTYLEKKRNRHLIPLIYRVRYRMYRNRLAPANRYRIPYTVYHIPYTAFPATTAVQPGKTRYVWRPRRRKSGRRARVAPSGAKIVWRLCHKIESFSFGRRPTRGQQGLKGGFKGRMLWWGGVSATPTTRQNCIHSRHF